jgi:NAD-dependent dihydropyrimidine dehydrogenase PreA subunit
MVTINEDLCIGCGLCLPYCTVGAIYLVDGKAIVDEDNCVECEVCIRSNVCPRRALFASQLLYPRSIKVISNPSVTKVTGIPGRGTDEVKTNDVTGRIGRGKVGICIDMGRPNTGVYLRDVEKVAKALIKVGVQIEKENPCTALMQKNGEFKEEGKNLRVLSIIIEGKTSLEKLPKVIDALKTVEKKVDTVFSVGVIGRVETDGTLPVFETLKKLKIKVRPNSKVNVGLGRPLSSR